MIDHKEIRKNRKQEDLKMKKIQKLSSDYQKLMDNYHKVEHENSVLKRIAKVPDNFGEEKLEIKGMYEDDMADYKKKVKYLEKEVEELEEDRARLRYKLREMSTLYSSKQGERYSGLTYEQLSIIDEFVLNIKSGRQELPVTDKTKELMKENDRLRAQLEVLEGQQGYQNQELLNNLAEKLEQIKTEGITNNSDKRNIKDLLDNHKLEIENLMRDIAAQKMVDIEGGEFMGLDPNINVSNKNGDRPHTGGKAWNIGKQFRPPMPIPGMFGDYYDCTSGHSYKFGTKLPVKNLEDDLGSDMDMETARFYIAALQLQNIENIELIRRKEEEVESLTVEVEEVKSRMRKCLTLQDELFVNHHKQKVDFDEKTKEVREMNLSLETTNLELGKRVELMERTLSSLRSGDSKSIESVLDETSRRATVAETNVVRLSRKYASLEEEHKDLLEKWKSATAEQSSREYQLIQRLEILKAWKEEATENIAILLERARSSVSLEDHRVVSGELELLQEKYANLKLRESEMVAKISKREGAEREVDEKDRDLRIAEEELSAAEVEIEVLQMRLNSVDPVFRKYSLIFQKLTRAMKAKNISPLQTFELFDKDKSNTLSADELQQAFTSMSINITPQETEILFMFLDLDGSGSIDYREYLRRLKRAGVAVRSKEEEIVNSIWEKIVGAGLTLENAFRVFDKDSNNLIEFGDMKSALDSLGINIDSMQLSELFKIMDITGDGKVTNAEFIHIFKRYNKVSYERDEDTHLDWKYDLMARLDKVARSREIPLEDIFNEIDKDKDGKVTVSELNGLFSSMAITLDKREFDKLFYAIDTNHSGFIGYPEFLSFINRSKREAERVKRARLLKDKRQQSTSESSFQHTEDDLLNDHSTRYQLKVALLEGKEKSAQHQIQKLTLKVHQIEDELAKEESAVKSLEDAQARTKGEYFREKERRTVLESRYENGISREQATKLKIDNEDLRLKITQLKGALTTFRGLHEAAVNEAKSLRLTIGRDKDEINQLREAVQELQGDSDDKALLGKLYKINLSSKWGEANQHQRYDMILDELKKLRFENKDLEAKNSRREKELFEIQAVFSERLMLLEGQLKEARMSILPTVSVSRIEDLALTTKRLADSKLDLELSNKKLREDNYELSVRVDNYVLREKTLQELERVLKEEHPDEISQRVIDISEQLSVLKLKELKAQRELYLIKEREEYYARVNRTQVDHIKKLEEELSRFELRLNEREDFWRKRYNDQLRVAFHEGEIEEGNKSDAEIAEELNIEMRKADSATREISLLDSKIGHNDSTLGQLSKAKEYRDFIQELKEQVKLLKEENSDKEREIRRLQGDARIKHVDTNYNTDNIDRLAFGELEQESKKMAVAAQQTIMTLQTMLEEKDQEIEALEKEVSSYKSDKLELVKDLRKIELKCQGLERESLINQRGKADLEHISAIKVLEKLGSMNHKEIEKLILDYENKIKVLTEEMSASEKNNIELVKKLREERNCRRNAENDVIKENDDDQISMLKREIGNLTKLNKKKTVEMQNLKRLLDDLKKDLTERDLELAKAGKSAMSKLDANVTQAGESEMKLAALMKRFKELNSKLKDAKTQLKEYKVNEITQRESETKIKEELNALRTENSKLKKQLSTSKARISVKDEEEDIKSTPKTRNRPPSSSTRRPSAKKTSKQIELEAKETNDLKLQVIALEEQNKELRWRIEVDFIDKDTGVLMSRSGKPFETFDEMLDIIRLFLNINTSLNIYEIMKKSDTKRLGLAKKEQFVIDMASAGIKFGRADERNFIIWIPQDKLGNVEYEILYMILMRRANQDIQTEDSLLKRSRNEKSSINQYSSMIPRREKDSDSIKVSRNIVDDERNIDILKRRIEDKNKEISKLNIQVHTWKEKALRYENDWKSQNNTIRRQGLKPISSEIDPNIPTQNTAMRMIKDLESELTESKKLISYEKELRDNRINLLNDNINNISNERDMLASEVESLRKQLAKIFSERLTVAQLSDEREQERELLTATLRERLEKSRKREEVLSEKLELVEKENIDLKYIKEGIDTRIEALNRRNRDLETSKKPQH